MSDPSSASAPAAPFVSPWRILAAVFAEPAALGRLFLAFLLWFATACVPYVNIGTTIGLLSCATDVARGRPVSPIEIFERRHRERIVPFCLTLGLSVAVMAGLALFSWLCAAQCVALFSIAPGPVRALSPLLRRLVYLAAFLPAPLVVGASISLSLPVFLDTGTKGLQALSRSRRLVAGNTAAVVCVELFPAVLGAALFALSVRFGFNLCAFFAAEAVAAVFALALLGRLYGALAAARPEA